MIKLYSCQLSIVSEKTIKDKMVENTCKTNINPQLMFKQSYTGITGKIFVGNWTKKGFWISRYKLQFFEFRPDIIARFTFNEDQLNIRYSLGFSSLFFLLILMVLFSSSITGGLVSFVLFEFCIITFYFIVAFFELNKLEKKIHELILS